VSSLRSWTASDKNPRGRILLVHGFAEHAGRLSELAKSLTANGLEVWAGDLRGHGKSPGQRGHIDGWRDYVEDVDSWVRALPESALPLFLFGHSLGGLVALDWVLLNPGRVQAVVLSSPAFQLEIVPPAWRRQLAKIVSKIIPTLSQPAGIPPDGISSVAEEVARYQNDPLVHDQATARFYVSFTEAQARLIETGPRVAFPVLILFGGDDSITAIEGARRFAASNLERIELRVYPGARHEVFHETPAIKDLAVRDLVEFLENGKPHY